MITFLALITAADILTTPPRIVKVFTSPAECLVAARTANAAPELNTPEALRAGSKFACLNVQYTLS
jgi:hypothetical protein